MAVHARSVYGEVQRDEVAGECDSGEVRREGSYGGAIHVLGARVGARVGLFLSCIRFWAGAASETESPLPPSTRTAKAISSG